MGEHRQEEELPLTPAMIATLGDGQAQTVRTAAVAIVGAAVIFSCLGIIMNNRTSWIQLGLLLAATAYAALIVVLYKGRKVRLDRESGRYCDWRDGPMGRIVAGMKVPTISSSQTWGGIARRVIE